MRKLIVATLAALALTLTAAGVASAAPPAGAAKGFLLVSVNGGVAIATPPGQAKQVVAANCPGVALDIDAVRLAFPAAVQVCPVVAVTSQVAAG